MALTFPEGLKAIGDWSQLPVDCQMEERRDPEVMLLAEELPLNDILDESLEYWIGVWSRLN
jgi:hypothetical protein